MSSDYERVARAIEYLSTHFREQPNLRDAAAEIGLSEFHFQRLFRRWAGISPKRFIQFLTADYAREVLVRSRDVFDATSKSGLSGLGRLHDLFVNIYAATPAQVRDLGANLKITFGFATTPFGECLMAETNRGLCEMSFVDQSQRDAARENLLDRWTSATLVQNDRRARVLASVIFAKTDSTKPKPITLFLQGTNFQIRVWEALVRVPPGAVVAYQDIADQIGAPDSVRAVSTAIGKNPIAYVIPCHRVLHKNGTLGGYRWGTDRKQVMLGWEAARLHRPDRANSLHA